MNGTSDEPACQRLFQRTGVWNRAVADLKSLWSGWVPRGRSRPFIVAIEPATSAALPRTFCPAALLNIPAATIRETLLRSAALHPLVAERKGWRRRRRAFP